MPGKRQNREGVLLTEILLQVVVTYKLSDGMTLSDTQEAARLASLENQGDEDIGLIVGSNEHDDGFGRELA